MKGLSKLTSMRLAEVLTQKGVVPSESITDALYLQDKNGDPFVSIMVDSGHIAEWDLARVVVENFQLPFLLAGSYDISDEAKARIPEEELFASFLVPLDLFDNVLTVAMPVLTTADILGALQKKHKVEIFPYVGLISENKNVLQNEFSGFKEWFSKHQKRVEKRRAEARAGKGKAGKAQRRGESDWGELFDDADAAVKASMDKGPPG